MSKNYGYDSSIVSYRVSDNYFHKDGEVKGITLNFLDNNGRIFFIERAVVSYLFKNAKSTDVFNLYHLTKETFVYGLLYKMFNPKGFLYIKLDVYNEMLRSDIVYSKNKIKNYFLKLLEKRLTKKADLFSVENREGLELFKMRFPNTTEKTIYLPNGVNDIFLQKEFSVLKKYSEKENLIITTGRIGMNVKNHEMILRAIAKVDLKGWKLYLVGPVHPPFMIFFEESCKTHPRLKEVVFFTGEVRDRKQLYEWYNKAKIFCMTSPHESFGISIVEAMYFGNYVIGTEGISTIKDLTNNGSLGAVVKLNDDDTLAKTFETLINNEKLISEKQDEIMKYLRENFLWSKLTARLNNRIN